MCTVGCHRTKQIKHGRVALKYDNPRYNMLYSGCALVQQFQPRIHHISMSPSPGMLTRPAGHEAKAEAEARKSGPRTWPSPRPKNFFEAEAEAEATHVRKQLRVYEHED